MQHYQIIGILIRTKLTIYFYVKIFPESSVWANLIYPNLIQKYFFHIILTRCYYSLFNAFIGLLTAALIVWLVTVTMPIISDTINVAIKV